MPVVVQTEKELIIDLFGKKPVVYDSDWYRTRTNQLVSVFNNKLKFIDLMSPNEFIEISIKSCEDALISEDGKKVLLKFYNNGIAVYNNCELVQEIPNVSMVDVSIYYFAYVVEETLYIFSFEEKKIIMKMCKKIKQVRCVGKICLIVTEEEGIHRLYMVKNGSVDIILELKNIYGIKAEISEDKNYYLILVDIEYTCNSYYAESNLYYFRLLTGQSNVRRNVEEQTEEEPRIIMDEVKKVEVENKASDEIISSMETTKDIKTTESETKPSEYDNKFSKTDQQNNKPSKKGQYQKQITLKNENELTLVNECKDWKIMCFKNMKKVLHFGFVNEKFYVCFGSQPACLNLYTNEGKLIKGHKKMVRNRVSFTRDETRIINAGFGNLPGNIQILANDVTTCSFESLGSSYAEWMNNDTHIIVATESYLKFDNKVTIYDYYGRMIDERKFSILKKANVYGLPEKPFDVEHMEMVQTTVSKYVPPHLKSGGVVTIPKFTYSRKNEKKGDTTRPKAVKKKSSEVVRTSLVVEKELELCQNLSKRLAEGEDLTPEEQTKIFMINKLKEELKGFEEKHTQK